MHVDLIAASGHERMLMRGVCGNQTRKARPGVHSSGQGTVAPNCNPSACFSILHCGIYHSVVFIESRQFTRRLAELAGGSAEDVLRTIQNDLMANPEKGSVMPGLNGIRKARIANPGRGKGKRGGYRYMHLYLQHRNHIHLLFLLDKGEQEDLTNEQRKALRAMVVELRGLL